MGETMRRAVFMVISTSFLFLAGGCATQPPARIASVVTFHFSGWAEAFQVKREDRFSNWSAALHKMVRDAGCPDPVLEALSDGFAYAHVMSPKDDIVAATKVNAVAKKAGCTIPS